MAAEVAAALNVTISVDAAPPVTGADHGAFIGDVDAKNADLAGAGALVVDRDAVLGEQAGHRQRAAVEVAVGVGEDDGRVDDPRRRVDGVLVERDRRIEAGQHRRGLGLGLRIDVHVELEAGAGVAEIMKGAVDLPRDEVEIAVAVEIGEGRRGHRGSTGAVDIDAVERIGGAGPLGEDRRDGGAGVLEIAERADFVSDNGIEIAVAVEVGEGGRAIAHTDAIERIGGAGLHREGRGGGGAGVLEIAQLSAPSFPDDGVEIAVAVEVGEARRAELDSATSKVAVERIGPTSLRREGRGDHGAGVLK